MNELTLKLKNEVVKQLTKNKNNIDDHYIVVGNRSYSRRKLAAAIENETKTGINILSDMIMLAIDLTSRNK